MCEKEGVNGTLATWPWCCRSSQTDKVAYDLIRKGRVALMKRAVTNWLGYRIDTSKLTALSSHQDSF